LAAATISRHGRAADPVTHHSSDSTVLAVEANRMVRLVTVSTTFHARVIAARLGSEGILCDLRGNVDGPYPMGDVHVFVPFGELDAAAELLLVDEVESAFDDDAATDDAGRPWELWMVVAAVVTTASLSLARAF
jgi:hypothetical protein